jgi:membrane associated rhomboid family serine protease
LIPLKDNAPTRHFPIVTVGLIVANVLVFFLYQAPDLEGSVAQLAYQPCEVNDSCPVTGEDWPLTSFTALFMHGSIIHLAGNMLFLWIFGNNVEDAMGKLRFVAFYLAGGLAATAVQTAVTLHYAGPAGESIPNVGASGAIAAVLGAYFVLLPGARVLTWIVFLIRDIPAYVFLGFWFLYQLWLGGGGLTHPEEGGGVAFFAHVGGFVFGALTVHLFAVRKPLRPRW